MISLLVSGCRNRAGTRWGRPSCRSLHRHARSSKWGAKQQPRLAALPRWQVAPRPLHSQCGAKHNRHYFPHQAPRSLTPTARAPQVAHSARRTATAGTGFRPSGRQRRQPKSSRSAAAVRSASSAKIRNNSVELATCVVEQVGGTGARVHQRGAGDLVLVPI